LVGETPTLLSSSSLLTNTLKCDPVSKTCLSLRTQRLLWLAKRNQFLVGHRNWAKLEVGFLLGRFLFRDTLYRCRDGTTDEISSVVKALWGMNSVGNPVYFNTYFYVSNPVSHHPDQSNPLSRMTVRVRYWGRDSCWAALL